MWPRALVLTLTVGLGCGSPDESAGADASPDVVPDVVLDGHLDASVTDASIDTSIDVADSATPDATIVVCSSLVNLAPWVTGQIVASDPPTPNGGSIDDGTYFQTAGIIYTGAGGKTGSTNLSDKEMIVLEAGVGQFVVTSQDGGVTTATMGLATNATNLTFTEYCPFVSDGGVLTLPYGTSDAGAFTWYVDLGDLGVAAVTFAKQ